MLTNQLGFPRMRGHEVLMVAFLVDALGTGLYLPFSILYFQRVAGLALSAIGLALTVATILTLPMTPITGTLVDQFGGQRMVVAGQLLQAVGFLGYLIVHSIAVLLGTALLVTAGSRVFYAASTALIAEVAGSDERDRWYGFVGATQNVGLGVGGLLAGFVVAVGGSIGYRVLILANVLSFLLAAILLHWHKGKPQRLRIEISQEGGYRAVLANRPFLGLVACNVILALCPFMLSIGLPIYVTETLKISTVIVGALFTFDTLLSVGMQTVIMRLLELHRRTRTITIASLVRAVGCILLVLALLLPHFVLVPYLFGCVAIYVLGGLMHIPTATALAAASSSPNLHGRYVAVYELSWGIAAALAPTMFTLLYTLGPAWPWAVLAGPILVAGLIMVWLEPHLPAQAVYTRR